MDAAAQGEAESAPVIFRGLPVQISGGNRTTVTLEKRGGQVFIDDAKVTGMVCNGTQLTLSTAGREYYVYNETTPFNMTVDRIYKLLKQEEKSGQP
jgi:hypothetical protein